MCIYVRNLNGVTTSRGDNARNRHLTLPNKTSSSRNKLFLIKSLDTGFQRSPTTKHDMLLPRQLEAFYNPRLWSYLVKPILTWVTVPWEFKLLINERLNFLLSRIECAVSNCKYTMTYTSDLSIRYISKIMTTILWQ